MNNEIRYDEIAWWCNFDNSKIFVECFDLKNQLPYHRVMTFKEVLGMVTDDGNGNHIDVTQEVFFWNKKAEPDDKEDSFRLGSYAFFAEVTGRDDEPRMTTETIKEYNEKVTQAISDLLEGKKKLLSLNEI